MSNHSITRVRRETRRRTLTVADVETLSPKMLRVAFQSDDLHDFDSGAPDDHIKIFFPPVDQSAGDKPCMRDFTPRAWDNAAGRLIVDFALHEAGPATQWAAQATAGQTIEIGGPRGSAIVSDDFDFYVLVGDETALPAIGRWVSELRAEATVATIVVVDGPGDEQSFETKASLTPIWVHRTPGMDDAAALRGALEAYAFPAGEGYVWIAAEAMVARSLRQYMLTERGCPKEWVKAAGYWRRGQADVHERIED